MNGIVVVADEGKGSHAETFAAIVNNNPLAKGQCRCTYESLWVDSDTNSDTRKALANEWGELIANKARKVFAKVLALDVGIHGHGDGALLIVQDLAANHSDVLDCLTAIALFSKNFRNVEPLLPKIEKLVACEVRLFDRNQQLDDLIQYVIRRAIGL